jgi:lysozyme
VNQKISINISQNQFDALVLHSFNTSGSDTLFDLINKGEPLEKIREWIEHTYITANGIILNGLIVRRKKEANLYCSIS